MITTKMQKTTMINNNDTKDAKDNNDNNNNRLDELRTIVSAVFS